MGRMVFPALLMTMQKRHLIISGTGRAGTTFLVQLLTQLGLDTGYSDPWQKIHSNCNAGMEWDIRKEDAPYIVKSPALCDYLDDFLKSGKAVIDHAIVPVRDLYAAAESRREVARKGDFKFLTPRRFLFWRIRNPKEQESVLTQHFYRLLHALARNDVPVTLLHFPRLAKNPDYLYRKLQFLLKDIGWEDFRAAFELISRPNMIHDFRKAERESNGELLPVLDKAAAGQH